MTTGSANQVLMSDQNCSGGLCKRESGLFDSGERAPIGSMKNRGRALLARIPAFG